MIRPIMIFCIMRVIRVVVILDSMMIKKNADHCELHDLEPKSDYGFICLHVFRCMCKIQKILFFSYFNSLSMCLRVFIDSHCSPGSMPRGSWITIICPFALRFYVDAWSRIQWLHSKRFLYSFEILQFLIGPSKRKFHHDFLYHP